MGKEFCRNEAWVEALELGDLTPTVAMAKDLDQFFGTSGDGGFASLLGELERNPYGERASSIRERYSLPPYAAEGEAGEDLAAAGEGAMPLVTSIRARDRLLVTGPTAMFITVATTQVALVLWTMDLLGEAAAPVIAGVVAVGALLMTLTLSSQEALLRAAVRITRSRSSRTLIGEARGHRHNSGLDDTYEHSWYQEGESPHLLPRVRARVATQCVSADLAERVGAVLLVNLVGAVLVAATFRSDWQVHLPTLAVIGSLIVLTRETARSAASRALEAVNVGLGFADWTG